MKVCGFTIVRNAIKYGYPAIESITSILPLCDLFIVAVGQSDDNTRALIESINSPKIKIIDTVWDDSLREGGQVLAVETNKAFDAIPEEYDWAFYIQADEVVHEQYHPAIRSGMERWCNSPSVDGLLFHYTHFYASYDYVGDSRQWYRNEIRIVRNNKAIRSYRDAQGFRKNGQKLCVKRIEAHVYHYGWVKPPEQMLQKMESFHKLWHDDQWVESFMKENKMFDYSSIDSIRAFTGTHPAVMKKLIDKQNWKVPFDTSHKKLGFKQAIFYFIEKRTGYRPFEYKNYKLI